ncbi:Uncharacterized protein dnl_28570 [Desulfonema limicola]|uniref:Uncharacterized protein n=1 Tax=Desulfonema limicola TaxID=45656 RepID=A0A975B7X9_9BACT|nr:Uncharacterized protein dnl_28570 [Desulfonema limicola]
MIIHVFSIFFANFLQGLKMMIKLLKFFIIQDIRAIIHLIRNKQI